jgi:FixJ family two-component response regulator
VSSESQRGTMMSATRKSIWTRGSDMYATDSCLSRTPPELPSAPIVYVVDGDHSARKDLEYLIRSAGWQARAATSAEEFLARPRLLAPGCLLVDQCLPGLSGLELQRLVLDRSEMPIIFMSSWPDLRLTVQAMKAGAFEFLVKPLSHDTVLKAIADAIEHSRAALPLATRSVVLEARYESLSPRERAVLDLVVRGRLNKQIGSELCISEITVKAHRGKMMRKMRATSVAELVNMAARLRRGTAPRAVTVELFAKPPRLDSHLGAIASYASV